MARYTARYVVSRKSLYYTLRLINDYHRETGSITFHYRQLRAFWDRRRAWSYSEWHTIERVIRELAHNGLLQRLGRGRFKITRELLRLAHSVEEYLGKARKGGGG